jgi:hypothetical protein
MADLDTRLLRAFVAVAEEPWIWIEGGDPVARAWWSLEEFRGGRPLRRGTRINSFDEVLGAIACQAESVVRAVGVGFPQLRFVRLDGAPPATVAVAWRTAHETQLPRPARCRPTARRWTSRASSPSSARSARRSSARRCASTTEHAQ